MSTLYYLQDVDVYNSVRRTITRFEVSFRNKRFEANEPTEYAATRRWFLCGCNQCGGLARAQSVQLNNRLDALEREGVETLEASVELQWIISFLSVKTRQLERRERRRRS